MLKLSLETSNKIDIIELHKSLPIYDVKSIEDITLFEDAAYKITLLDDENTGELNNINRIEMLVNGEVVGEVSYNEPTSNKSHNIEFEKEHPQPFLLQYDLVSIGIKIYFKNDIDNYYSNYILCLSRNEEDRENISSLIKEIENFEDSKINNWLFRKTTRSSLLEGAWKENSHKSVGSYLQMVEEIYQSYKDNLPFFRNMAKHKVSQCEKLQPYDKVRSINSNSFLWIMKNGEKLSQVAQKTAIENNGEYYLPLQIQSTQHHKDYNIYENQIILSFLCSVYQKLRSIDADFEDSLNNNQAILDKLRLKIAQWQEDAYSAPIITIKTIQMENMLIMRKKLVALIKLFADIFGQYKQILCCDIVKILSFPKCTKIFQEVRVYNNVFNQIVKWYKFGDFDLAKEKLVFNIKTLDKLFEYYCLHKIINMITFAGFNIKANGASCFEYSSDGKYENETDLANSFAFSKDNIELVLYYQPVIFSNKFENDISLYRTTGNSYYSPDFLISINKPGVKQFNAVFDAKFCSKKNIDQYHLDKCKVKYFCELSDKNGNPVNMLWLLKGRMDKFSNSIYENRSSMARLYNSAFTCGIASINTKSDTYPLWNSIAKLANL